MSSSSLGGEHYPWEVFVFNEDNLTEEIIADNCGESEGNLKWTGHWRERWGRVEEWADVLYCMLMERTWSRGDRGNYRNQLLGKTTSKGVGELVSRCRKEPEVGW